MAKAFNDGSLLYWVVGFFFLREGIPKKVTKLRTFSVPPLAPPPLPASTDTYWGLFSKSAYWRLAIFGEKARMLPTSKIYQQPPWSTR